MAKNVLPTNFLDDILNISMEGKRKYRMIQNTDGTVSFEDASEYDQVGSAFGAGQINKTNEAVNESADKNKIIDSLNTIDTTSQSGYIAGALALKKLSEKLCGCWIAFEDEKGSATNEPYIHWMAEE